MNPRLPRTLVFLLIVGSSLVAPVSQAAAPTKTPALPPLPPTKTTLPKSPDSINATPSRFITEENLPTYVAAASAQFSMRTRTTDPFGQLQDPDAKPVVKTTVAKASHRAAPVQATPFSDIVRLIKVTTVMPKEQRFLIGTRAVKQGDTIPLAFRGKSLRVEVAAVSSHQIDFRNLDNNETASLKLDILPAGMTAGSHAITAPGMVHDRTDSPIELESSALPNEKTHAR